MVTVENVSLSGRCWRLDKRVVFSGLLQEFIQTSMLYRLLSVCASIQIRYIEVKIWERRTWTQLLYCSHIFPHLCWNSSAFLFEYAARAVDDDDAATAGSR